jgi:uncharacterized membrane protein
MSENQPVAVTPEALQATKLARQARVATFGGLVLSVISILGVMTQLAVRDTHKPHVILGIILILGVLAALGGAALAVTAIRRPGHLTRRGYVHLYLTWATLGFTILVIALSWWTLPYFLGAAH